MILLENNDNIIINFHSFKPKSKGIYGIWPQQKHAIASKYSAKIILSIVVIVNVTDTTRIKIIIIAPNIINIIENTDQKQVIGIMQQHPEGKPMININIIKVKIQQQKG